MAINSLSYNRIPTHDKTGVSYKGINSAELRKIGQELAGQLSPKAVNPKVKILLERISDLSMFKSLEEMPECRIKSGFAQGDIQFQKEIQRLIDTGIIKPQTMVIYTYASSITCQR